MGIGGEDRFGPQRYQDIFQFPLIIFLLGHTGGTIDRAAVIGEKF